MTRVAEVKLRGFVAGIVFSVAIQNTDLWKWFTSEGILTGWWRATFLIVGVLVVLFFPD